MSASAVPRISVVVPVYNVEEYLDECLTSLVRQTASDLEIVIVDDGSTDSSAAIAQRYAARDARIRIVTRPNGGLGAARNTGIEEATGEYLAFLDSDDVLPPTAYELLLNSLEQTGSDFATGNVHRLTAAGTSQAPFLARVFARDRPKTHVKRFRELISDRIVPNKLWRRSFWDQHGFRFPEGMLHEDIPVVIPAHFLARSVDVIAQPVYHYRVRESGDLSITQRRAEKRALLDRLKAVELARDHLVEHAPRRAHRWYEDTVIAEDLRYHLNVLEVADDEYREIFVERVNAFFDRLGRRNVLKPLRAIDRLKYHLVRRRLMPELLEVLRFQREDMSEAAPVRVRGRWYGDYPFRTDRALKIPSWIYRLEIEMPLVAQVDELWWEGETLHISGFAFIRGVAVDHAGAQRISVLMVRGTRLRRLLLALAPIRFRTRSTHRPDATNSFGQGFHDVSWSGFEASIRARRLKLLGRWRYGGFDIYISARAGGIRRRRIRFTLDPAQRPRADSVALADGTLVRSVPAATGSIQVRVAGHWAALREHRRDDDEIVVGGALRMAPQAKLKLELLRTDGSASRTYPITVAGNGPTGTFEARIPVGDLASEHGVEVPWWLLVTRGDRRHRVLFPPELAAGAWQDGAREIALRRTAQGDAVLEDRRPRPMLTAARWTPEGDLEVEGELHAAPGAHAAEGGGSARELVLAARDLMAEHVFPIQSGDERDRFHARIGATRVPSLAGPLPLRQGLWELLARPVGTATEAEGVPVMLSDGLHAQLPIRNEVDHKPFALGTTHEGTTVVVVRPDLDSDERGPYHQRRLRTVVYGGARSEPLRDAVVYTSFGGRQCSDSPRAIHDELVRRGAPLEHLWVVADGMARAPDGSVALRENSREHHEALARARYVVSNDHFPEWFRRREDQVGLQTWHGTPLKRLGFDVSAMLKTKRRFETHWDEQVRNWQYVISPNHFSTPILQRAYRLEGEMLETGYPRIDVLARPDREEAGRRLRARLGLPEGVRTVLYAPTYRDQVIDRRNRYRLDLHLDIERLRAAVGQDTVILFRKHHYVLDPVPATADGFVRDVSSYPDGTELMLAADVLVTDYSSMMFDYANTGRPMLFFTYDLDTYRDEVRGFYFDFLERAPGPLLRTSDQVAEALRDLDAVRARYAQRYADFVAQFCELDDGGAAARVVERVFSQH
jgi:CDP-glycerol glycerophosphotransferase